MLQHLPIPTLPGQPYPNPPPSQAFHHQDTFRGGTGSLQCLRGDAARRAPCHARVSRVGALWLGTPKLGDGADGGGEEALGVLWCFGCSQQTGVQALERWNLETFGRSKVIQRRKPSDTNTATAPRQSIRMDVQLKSRQRPPSTNPRKVRKLDHPPKSSLTQGISIAQT